ncbi:MAG: histidine phosphatase family protein [Acidimicrobiia bacterium]
MTAPETRLLLIRHGESDAQARGYLSGHDACGGLSDTGREQVETLRDRLIATGELGEVDAVYTSILARAIETTEILAPALGEAEPRQECAWCEIHPGEAEGLTWTEFRERFPVAGDLADPYRQRAPGAETWAEFYVRAGTRLRRIADDHPGERVVVVYHGGIIGASFVALGELPLQHGHALTHETVNTSLTEWRHTGSEWRLVRYNDASHLASR